MAIFPARRRVKSCKQDQNALFKRKFADIAFVYMYIIQRGCGAEGSLGMEFTTKVAAFLLCARGWRGICDRRSNLD
jgi:hypothetical protein